MQKARKSTLTQFLIEERRRYANSSGEFNSLILDIAIACKGIAHAVANAGVNNLLGNLQTEVGELSTNIQGETQKKLDVYSNELFIQSNEWSGNLAGMASEEMEEPYQIPAHYPKGKYLLVFDPLDGSSNIDVNVTVGSIFSVLKIPDGTDVNKDISAKDFFQKGCKQLAAGYALFGPSTMLVITFGTGVHAFTLDTTLGEFILTHQNIKIPENTQEFAINASNSRFWEAPIKRYVDECLAGKTGERGKDFNMRWIASMVAETHRILMRGGVFMYPKDTKDSTKEGRLRLLYEANPIGFIIEQAGGLASNGRMPILQIEPTSLHQRIGLIMGSKNEVELIEKYHHEPVSEVFSEKPLFSMRGLFRE